MYFYGINYSFFKSTSTETFHKQENHAGVKKRSETGLMSTHYIEGPWISLFNLITLCSFLTGNICLSRSQVITSYCIKVLSIKIKCLETNMPILGCLNTHLEIMVLEIIILLFFRVFFSYQIIGGQTVRSIPMSSDDFVYITLPTHMI